MQCAQCQHENREARRFCTECGTPLAEFPLPCPLGFVIVSLNTRHVEPKLKYALEDGGVRVLLADHDFSALADVVETVMMRPDEYERGLTEAQPMTVGESIDENTLAGLFYTGGTTGASQGVMLTYRHVGGMAMGNFASRSN